MPRNPYLIAGSLPWAGGGSGGAFEAMQSSDPMKGLASHYAQAYKAALDMNERNYGNILRGYQQTQQGLAASGRNIGRGYADIVESIRGAGGAAAADISDRYAQSQGRAQQNLIDSGLGNSTVLSDTARGLTQDEMQERGRLAENVAQLMAGFQTNLMKFKEGQLDRRTGQANQQLNWMNSIQAQYPDGSLYAQMAQNAAGAEEAEKARAFMRDMIYSSRSQFGTSPWGMDNPLQGGNAASGMAREIASAGGFNPPSGGGGETGPGQPSGRPGRVSNPYSVGEGGWGKGPGMNDPADYSYAKPGSYPDGGFSVNKGTGMGFWGSFNPPPGYMSERKGSGGYEGMGFSGEKGGNPYGVPAVSIDLSGLSSFGGMGGLWGN